MLGGNKKSIMSKPGTSALAPKSKMHFEGFKGLEPLRDGDDVNLNSEECEDLKGKDCLDVQSKGKPPPPGVVIAPRPDAPKVSATSKDTATTASKSKSDRSPKKTLILSALVTIVVMLVLTSTTTIVVTLHWYGSISWFPSLSAALQGTESGQ